MSRSKNALLVTEARDDPWLIEGDPTGARHENIGPDIELDKHQFLTRSPYESKHNWEHEIIEAASCSMHPPHLGVVDEVLHDLFFVQPATVPVVQTLR